ncbi:MAG: hypothetical protein Q8K32_24980 [Archangium sp.]|nr:hypothetical protein [Archangium sp.]
MMLFASCGAPQLEPVDAGTPDAGRVTLTRDAGVDAGIDAGQPTIDAGVRDAGPNHEPQVNPVILQNRTTAYAGQIVELALGATDEDGDRLTFAWSGPGTFFENGTPSAQRWFSDERAAPTQLLLTASVTDNRSAPITRQLTINITVPRFTDVFSTLSTQGERILGDRNHESSVSPRVRTKAR